VLRNRTPIEVGYENEAEFASGLLVGAVFCGSPAMAIDSKPTLSLDLAKKMTAGC
jgi:hypothetical protein